MPITVPGHRFAYDLDGSVGFVIANGGTFTTLTLTELEALNDESSTFAASATAAGGANATLDVGVVFPQARTILGVFGGIGAADSYQWAYSNDTTTGQDGSWTNFTATVGTYNQYPNIVSVNLANVRGVKLYHLDYATGGHTVYMYMMHLYGDIPSGEVPDRLELWHPTLNQQLAANDLNWGDIPRGSSDDFTFRVKNVSTTQTANNITVSLDALAGSTAMEAQHSLSDDGSTFGATVIITSLAPDTISSLLTVRRITPSDASIGFYATRLVASAASWT